MAFPQMPSFCGIAVIMSLTYFCEVILKIPFKGREDIFVTAPCKLTADDLWSLSTMGNIVPSPNGQHIAFVMHSEDQAKNERRSTIMLLHLDEQGHAIDVPRQLTSGLKNDSSPV